jgi:aryl-phospho-beta-D-glucosidase BglC (GH1 family)
VDQQGFLRGVNYGNRFIPEDWMANSTESIYGTRFGPEVHQPSDCARVSLCDVNDGRILKWLDYKVQEDDFVKIKEYGVKMLRVPTGYWNWVDLGDATPNAPPNVAERFKNLQAVKPD